MTPACAKACRPSRSSSATSTSARPAPSLRKQQLHEAGVTDALVTGTTRTTASAAAATTSLAAADEPEVYGLPPDPVVTTRDLPAMWKQAALAAGALAAGVVAAFLGRRS